MENKTSATFYRRTPNTHEIKKETNKMYAQLSKEYQQLLEKTLSEELLNTVQSKMDKIESKIIQSIKAQLKPQIAQEAHKQVSEALRSTTLEVQVKSSESLETRLNSLELEIANLAKQQYQIIQTLALIQANSHSTQASLTSLNETLNGLTARPTPQNNYGGTLYSMMKLLKSLNSCLQSIPTSKQLQSFGAELTQAHEQIAEALTMLPTNPTN